MADLVAVYLELFLSGARFEDERLAVLREVMTPDEREKASQALATDFAPRAHAADVELMEESDDAS